MLGGGAFVIGLKRRTQGVGGKRELVNMHGAVEERLGLTQAPRGADSAVEGTGGKDT